MEEEPVNGGGARKFCLSSVSVGGGNPLPFLLKNLSAAVLRSLGTGSIFSLTVFNPD